MELKIDLLKKDEKSYFRIAFGVFFIVVSCVCIVRMIHDEVLRPFDWLYFYLGIFALGGIIHVVEGLGLFSLRRLFGKAYILINPKLISLKPDVLGKEQSASWDSIKSIDYKLNKLVIEKTDNTNVVISLSKFSFILKNEIKETISYIAREKSIKSNM